MIPSEMVDESVRREIEELRAELSALVERVNRPGEAVASDGSAADLGRTLREEVSEKLDPEQVQKHLKKFLDSLGQDIKDSKPKALVAAFLAGFLAGRSLGR